MPGIALLIGEGLSLALPIVTKLVGHGKWEQWVGVFQEAAGGIPTAIEAIKSLIAGGDDKDYTNEELDALLAHSTTFHDRIQNG